MDLAAKSGISETLILEWVNLADLMRVNGDTVKELRNRVAGNLHQAMLNTNMKKRLVRRPPSLSMVKRWVAEAKQLPPVVEY